MHPRPCVECISDCGATPGSPVWHTTCRSFRGVAETVGRERKELVTVLDDTIRRRRQRGLSKAAGLALGLALVASPGLPVALAQDEGVTVGGGGIGATASASDIEAVVNSILAEVFGDAGVAGIDTPADDSMTTGGDINVGGNMGGSVTTGGGGGISIGGGSTGSIAVE